jgi:hypothetical protein
MNPDELEKVKIPNHFHCRDCGSILPCSCSDIYEDDEIEDNPYEQEEIEEKRLEKAFDRASACKCGAYKIINGAPVTIADCCCGL